MKIRKIDIRNFRGFEHKSFELDDNLTVVVGNNTSGKTTLLQALQVALGAYLKSLASLPSDPAYNCNFVSSDQYTKYIAAQKDFFKNTESTRIQVYGKFPVSYNDGEGVRVAYRDISWYRELKGRTTTHSQSCVGELISCVREMEEKRESYISGDGAVFPLVLSFGSNRIDNQYRTAKKKRERESRITKAYKSALKETVDFKGAFDWLYNYGRNMKRGDVFEGNMEAFRSALQTAIPALREIDVNMKDAELLALVEVRGLPKVYQTFEHMSDGLKSMICIVAEIAHRCIELNGFLGADAVKKTPGIVIIDEVDLYLHPRWQQHILSDLRNAFPEIQFVVSSHSPFIIQSVKSENLITLDGLKGSSDPIYRSIEEIAASEMNIETLRSKRYKEMLDRADKYYRMVRSNGDTGDYADALREELNKLEAEFSDNPAYVALLRAEKI